MKLNSIDVLPRLAFISRKERGEADLIKFDKIKNDRIIKMVEDEENDMSKLSMLRGTIISNKPISGGLWTSPITDDGRCEWLDHQACNGDFDTDYMYEVIPDPDCRVLVIDSLDDYLDFEKKYYFDFKKVKKDFDVMYVTSKGIRESVYPTMNTYRLGSKREPYFYIGLYGWDIESALFLRKKFKFGRKIRINDKKINTSIFNIE